MFVLVLRSRPVAQADRAMQLRVMENPGTTRSARPSAVLEAERAAFALLRRVFWTAAVAVAGLAVAVVVLFLTEAQARRATEHSREVGRLSRTAQALATDRETGLRGYLLTRDTISLQPEKRARLALPLTLDSLVAMTADDPGQQSRARAVRAAASRWDRYYAQPVLSSRNPWADAATRERELAGKELFDEFRQANRAFLGQEEARYRARVRRDHAVQMASLLVMLVSLAALAGVLGWMYRRVNAQTTDLLDQQAKLEEQAVELELSAAEIEATSDELQANAVDLELANEEMRTSEEEAKRSRERADRAKEQLEAMLDRVNDMFIEYDAEWRITYLNRSAEIAVHQTLADVRGRTLWEVFPATVGTVFETNYRKAMAEQTPVSFEYHYYQPGQLDIWTAIRAYPSPDALTVLFSDITQQKRAEEIVARRDQRFTEAQRIAHLGSWEYEVASSVSSWSEEMCRVLGQPADTVASLDVMMSQVVGADQARVRAAVARAISHCEPFSVECLINCPDGIVRAVHARGAATCDAEGRTVSIVGTVQDIAERRQLEAQLQQSQKMEAVGQLAGGVAHDFNNVLTAIKSFSELVAIDLPPDSPLQGDVREISAAADRAAALTRHLLAFSRRQMLQPVVLDPNGVVEGVTKMITRLIGVDIRCDAVLAPDIGRVFADPGQLEQVIINLAVNARDAMPQGGTLTLETANVLIDERQASRLSGVEDATPGDYVMLTVSDTGEGMDAATQTRIFEPFFTTKETGKGTGLGLSTVYGIVRQSGGHVAVYSELGKGTTFRVYLPRVTAEVEVVAPKPLPLPPPNGKETILLVDDDEAVRTVAKRILTRAGYEVLCASSPGEAETIWAAHPATIHLLMTDLMMPEMNGGELARRLLETRAGTRVLYTSGYTNETVIRRGLIISDMPFLAKPFTIDDVVRKVRETLSN